MLFTHYRQVQRMSQTSPDRRADWGGSGTGQRRRSGSRHGDDGRSQPGAKWRSIPLRINRNRRDFGGVPSNEIREDEGKRAVIADLGLAFKVVALVGVIG